MPRHPRLNLVPADAPPPGECEPDVLDEGVYDAEKACAFLSCGYWHLRRLVAQGRLKALQDGKGCRLLFPKVELKRYLATLGKPTFVA
jgi:excisionase family DNA binding protein